MVVQTVALYANPPGGVCSAHHQINAHSTNFELDFVNGRSSSTASSSASTHSIQKSTIGGLSCLFSSHPAKHSTSSSFCGEREDLGPLRHDRCEEFKVGSKYFGGSYTKSPVSVLQPPMSCSSSSSVSGTSPLRIGRNSGVGAHSLFKGFVTHALGSCVEYDASPFRVGDMSDFGVSCGPEELTFNLEDGFSDSTCTDHEPFVKDMLGDAQSRHKTFLDDFVVKAFYEAEKAHRGQVRATGDPYLKHCVETAISLAMIGASSSVVAAGLLHDAIDDSFLSYDYIFRTFGEGVADMVEGVSKLSHLSKLARDNNTACKNVEADRLHTMFLAMADPRAVLIKLADRLHNMMTLDALPLAKQQRFAKETLEIFVPLANRLGISTWKEQLENLCFKHLNPDQHQELSARLVEAFDEALINSATEKLEEALKNESVVYSVVYGRHKSLFSIYCKMLKKKLEMNEIHDIHGLRLIVETEEDCYRALEVVHRLWKQVPGKFKDYVSQPKFNGYQSLHTVVEGDCTIPFEVQIRTKEMHLQAEIGFAAHWRYKERDCKHSSFVVQMVEWARWVVTWQCETMRKDRSSVSLGPPCAFPSHSSDCQYSYLPYCGQDGPVFVIMIENEKMSVQELPVNSTVTDLLARAGRGSSRCSPYGFPVKEQLRPRLNHVPVSDPSRKLMMGDVVELSPPIPDKSLMEFREEFQRLYNRDPTTLPGTVPASSRRLASKRN